MLQEKELFTTLQKVIKSGKHKLIKGRHGGTGGPGKLLEDLLGIDGSNIDLADAGKWELKTSTGKGSLLTLFHKEGKPPGYMRTLLDEFGYHPQGDISRPLSLRSTIKGRIPNNRGLYVQPISDKDNWVPTHIGLYNAKDNPTVCYARWDCNVLLNAFASKFRHLLFVTVDHENGFVSYRQAIKYSEPQSTNFINLIGDGTIRVDLDARYKYINKNSIRNHGTKFRIPQNMLPEMYLKREPL